MTRTLFAVAFSLLLVSSVAVGTVSAGALGSADGTGVAAAQAEETLNESADEIYRYENGSAVLVSHGEESEDVTSTEFGADVSTGLVDILVVSESEADQEVTGEFGLEITQEAVSGDGQLAFQSPEAIEELDASVSGTLTPEQNTAEMTLDMTARGGTRGPQADSTGEIIVGADSFAVDVEFSGQNVPGSMSTAPESQVIRMTELDGGYEVQFDQERPITERMRERWETADAARQTVSQQYQAIAQQFGGTADVTIESHEYTTVSDGSDRLDISYTVTLNDVKEGIAQQLVEQVSASGDVELSAAERSELKQGFMDLTVEHLAVAQNKTESGTDGFVNAEITGYEAPMLTYMGAYASEDGPINDSEVETLRQQLEARSAAGLEQSIDWDVDVTAADSQTTRVQAAVNYDTTNWNAYTDELADRGMPFETDVTFDGSAQTVDGNIEMEMSFNVKQAQLVDSAVGQLSDTADQESADPSTVEAVRSLENAELEVAKADFVFNRDRVEVRAAAQFEDLSAFESAVEEMPEGTTVRQIYGEGEGDGTTTYVYVEGLDMSDEELRETPLADEDTTIHSPGEWDRSFPVMDVQSTADYLGVDVEADHPPHNPGAGGGMETETATATPTEGMATDTATPTTGDTPTPTSGFGPGPGAIAALLALLAGALLARREDQR